MKAAAVVGSLLRPPVSTEAIMFRVVAAMVPCIATATVAFGVLTLAHCALALGAGAVVEACARAARGLPLRVFADGSAPVTCLLIALAVPPSAPLWITPVAVLVGLGLAREAYGGLGRNVFNPAMAGYAAVLVAWPHALTWVDGQTGATALDALRFRGADTVDEAFRAATFGIVGGRGFEWVNAAALVGGLYLVATRVVHWRIPLAVLLGMGLPALALHDGGSSESLGSPLFHWFSGATMLGAFFIATDPVTAPRGEAHQWLFGIGIGAVTFLIRADGGYPDGLAFAVLLGNLAAPALDALQRRGTVDEG
ncbi:MAG: RnfABCDGE type electron transport complex subunit D [Gammaproteobacteria bacterium]|nr:RnfABCDGE type electron transport complex subunit D [Gammaproteobacteria bacterium]